ncbi:MAG TPA: hypothetical protein VMV21_12215, partial [Vicinamibacteria bacterium]|nr:hypothetical protein [Vicinamibacteria bacterium]
MARRNEKRPDHEEAAPRSLTDVLRRRSWGGVIAFLIVLAPLASLVYFLPDVYRSSTTILIQRQEIPDDLVKSTVTGAIETRISTINTQILSRPSLVRVIRCFGLYGFERKKDVCTEKELEAVDLRPELIPETVIEQMRQDVKM